MVERRQNILCQSDLERVDIICPKEARITFTTADAASGSHDSSVKRIDWALRGHRKPP